MPEGMFGVSRSRRSKNNLEQLLFLVCFILLLLALSRSLNRCRKHLSSTEENTFIPHHALCKRDDEATFADHEDLICWLLPSTLKVIEPSHSGDGELNITPGITIQNDGSAGFLYAARGEYESIQLVLYTDGEIAHLPVQYLPAGTKPLPEDWVNIYRVLTVNTPGVAKWGFPENKPERRCTAYPDPLLPLQGALSLEPGEFKVLWLSINVPCNAVSGEYTGEISLGGARVPLHLKVWPFAIPGASTLRTAFGLGGKGFASHHQVAYRSDEYQEIYRLYYDALLDYRINAYHLPYGGGGAGGSLLDPRARPYLKDERVGAFIGYYHQNEALMAETWAYLEQQGVLEKAWIFNLDEPLTEKDYSTIEKQAAYLDRLIPEIPYGVTFHTGPPWDQQSSPFDYLSSSVDRWIIQTNYFVQGRGREESFKEQLGQAYEDGDEVWLYVSLAPREPYCNLLLNNAALQHRLLPWQCYSAGIVSGFLYWQTTFWEETSDPYNDQATVKKHDPHLYGDGSLFYPGAAVGMNGPVGSIRLHNLRDGLEDYEYLVLAEQAFGRAETMELVEAISPSFGNYIEDPFLFETVRQSLGEKLSRYYGGG